MSAATRWMRVKALFAESLEQPDEARAAWLAQACAKDPALYQEVASLLEQRARSARIFGGDVQQLLRDLIPEAVADARLGSRVGPYRLIGELGAGGMGRVYLAERADGQFAQQVALKLVRTEFASAEMKQRFLRERDTLARLAHPNIAQLHDGGVGEDGVPYFTLEYVAGVPITRWCDAHRADVRARVALLVKLCDAVQHAHRSLVVHRDLKPSNILVTDDGEPKLLDFGIAKPLAGNPAGAALTNTDAQPMTRDFAAPEQVLGEPVTTATDIYALGVLLYLLLTGRMPYRRAELGQTSWIKAIIEDAPEPMDDAVTRMQPADRGADATSANADEMALASARSTTAPMLKRSLRGDLERIVQRALAKPPEARYPAASAMADDLRAYLDGRALSGGARTYRVRKFVRRHWVPIAAGALLLAVVLASALGLLLEAQQVEREARTTAAVKDFLIDLFQNANPEIANGKVPSMRDAVDLGVKRLDAIPASEAQLRAELQVTLGMIYNQLGLPKQARDMHHEAVAVLKERSPDPLLTVRAERFEAVETGALGDFAAAHALAEDALDRIHRLSHPPVADLVRTLDTVNYVAIHRSDRTRQKQVSEEAVRAIEGADVDDEVRAMALVMKGDYARKSHDDATAIEYYKRVWPLRISPQTRSSYGMVLGTSLQNLGRYDEAADYLGKTWDSTRQAYGESNSRTLRVGQVLVVNEAYAGHLRQANEHIAQLLEASLRQSPLQEDVIAEIRINYGETLMALEQYDLAAAQVAQTLAYCAAHPNGEPALHAEAESSMGYIAWKTGKVAEAQRRFAASLSIAQARHVPDTEVTQARLGLVTALGGDVNGGLRLAQRARDEVVVATRAQSPDAAEVHYLYARTLELAGRPHDAAAEYRASIAVQALLLPPDGLHFYSADARFALARLLMDQAQTRAEARNLFMQAAALREATLGADNPRTMEAQAQLKQFAGEP